MCKVKLHSPDSVDISTKIGAKGKSVIQKLAQRKVSLHSPAVIHAKLKSEHIHAKLKSED
jgi:hypothetical protein